MMKKKNLITIILIMVIALIIVGVMIIYFRSRNLNNEYVYFSKDVYTSVKLSDEEYKNLSETILSKLEYDFGKEGGFAIRNIEKGYLNIDDVAYPKSYQKVEVYSEFLNDTFDGQSSSFISKLFQKYSDELSSKIKRINENMNVSIVKQTSPKTTYGHIPILEEVPNEDYSIEIYYTSDNETISSSNIDKVVDILKTDLKEAYYIILESDPSYKNRKIEVNYVINNSTKNYQYITISINPTDKIIDLAGVNIQIPHKSFKWNEIF